LRLVTRDQIDRPFDNSQCAMLPIAFYFGAKEKPQMKKTAGKRVRWLAHVPAGLLAITLVSLITGWVTTDPLGSVPSVSSSAAAVIQIEPSVSKPKPIVPGEIAPSLRPSVADRAFRGSLQ
jgi:hypothetical protein